MKRLYVVVLITLGLIFLMLFSTFGSLRYAALIFLNVPFATIGGIVALGLGGLYVSVPAAVGFIAVFGVAVLNSVVLVSYINQLRAEGKSMKEATVIGGLVTSTLLTLLVLPSIYPWFAEDIDTAAV